MRTLLKLIVLWVAVLFACHLLLWLIQSPGHTTPVFAVGLILAVLVVLVYRRSRYFPERLFFSTFILLLFAAHLFASLFIAEVAIPLLPYFDSDIIDSVSLAQQIVLCGLIATAVSYWFLSKRPSVIWRSKQIVSFLSAEPETIYARARLVVIGGSLFIVGALIVTDYFPLLQENPLLARVQFNTFSGHAALFSLLSKIIDVVSVSAPALVVGRKISLGSALLFGLALLSVALTASRECFLFMLVFAPACLLVRQKRNFLILLRLAPIAFLPFFLTDAYLKYGNQFEDHPAIQLAATVLPEVRDLGWTLDLWDGTRLNGRTYVGDLIPLPSAVVSFKGSSTTSSVTKQIVGIPVDAPHGGLRITGYGQAWLNFGLPGVVVFGVLLGWLVSVLEAVLAIASELSPIHFYGATAMALTPVLYLYLSGTAAIWDQVIMPVLFIWVLFRSPGRLRGYRNA